MKKKYTINDLSKYSPWPARLLGLEKFEQKHKTRKEVVREFEKEKWGALFDKILKQKRKLSINEVDEIHHGHSDILYYDHKHFKVGDAYNVHKKFLNFINKEIIPHISKSDNIVELGSGYGAVILELAKKLKNKKINFFATEFTKSGLEIIKKLSADEELNIVTGSCDITKNPITRIKIPENSLIFTSSVAYIIPELKVDFIKNIAKLKPKIVIHIEPLYEDSIGNDLYSLLRKKYFKINDYNKNLLTILKKCERKKTIEILGHKPTVFGSNPLFCCSVIKWKPKYK